MKKYILILPLLMFAFSVLACDDRLSYNYGKTEMVTIAGTLVEVKSACLYHPGGNGIISDSPCMGLHGDFLVNCRNGIETMVEPVVAPVVPVTTSQDEMIKAQIAELQTQLIDLLTQLIAQLSLMI